MSEANNSNLLYAERDIIALDESGDFYCKHVSAMTGEKLHSKSDIAAELGYRDKLIADFKELWAELVSNADDQNPFGVCISRADYETMMSFVDSI